MNSAYFLTSADIYALRPSTSRLPIELYTAVADAMQVPDQVMREQFPALNQFRTPMKLTPIERYAKLRRIIDGGASNWVLVKIHLLHPEVRKYIYKKNG